MNISLYQVGKYFFPYFIFFQMDFSDIRAISCARASSSYLFVPKNICITTENDFEHIFLSKVKVN